MPKQEGWGPAVGLGAFRWQPCPCHWVSAFRPTNLFTFGDNPTRQALKVAATEWLTPARRTGYDTLMAQLLAPLRPELDIMPSPVPDQPGLLIRDPFHYSDATIIVPPLLAKGLVFFDGEHSDLDLKEFLTRVSGDLRVMEAARNLIDTMTECGFLDSKEFHEMRDQKQREFAEAVVCQPAHVGTAYPSEPDALRQKLSDYGTAQGANSGASDSLVALAAPHVSPEGGFRSYAAAYRRLGPQYADKTFVILGTSHYGQPEQFGLTRKPFVTPLGTVETDNTLVDWLAAEAPESITMEDYCHASEHSIEFQCVFLQQALGSSDFKIVPILCGPLAESLLTGKAPQANESVRRFFEALGELGEKHRKHLIWILGIDLAHIGRRYGDRLPALAEQGSMQQVRSRDEARLKHVCEGDAEAFFELVHPNQDELRWCGYSPVYTFLQSVQGVRGEVLKYEQWNIDQQSVVSFAGIEFVEAE